MLWNRPHDGETSANPRSVSVCYQQSCKMIFVWDCEPTGYGDAQSDNIMTMAMISKLKWHHGYDYATDQSPFDAY